MKKLIPCMLAGLIITGLFALCITSFLAPSANYIQDNLEPTEEPFYITLQPDNFYGTSGEPILLNCRSNIDDVSYTWQVSSPNSSWATVSYGSFIDGCLSFTLTPTSSVTRFYRCCISYGDRSIYSAPCLVFVSSSSPSSLLKSDFDSEIHSEFVESENIEEFEESEVTE